ncbi:MAG: N-acetyltransferase [Chthonomonadales bacterium]|nr:N-acetyltransferase [Chthonomonadales bacterium]
MIIKYGPRKAATADVPGIQRIVSGFAAQGLMLPRSLSQLYESVRDFFVIEEAGEIVGCAALHVSWKDLAEIKSLAVAATAQSRGYGRELVEACLREARPLGVTRVFALTYVPEFFARLGFGEIDKALLPRKVWTECVHCPKFLNCTEVAVIRELKDG